MFRKYSHVAKIFSRSLRLRPFTTAAAESVPASEQRFSRPLQWLHWFGAGGITFCTVSAVIAGQIPNDPAKTTKEKYQLRQSLMHNHESVGILMLIALFPRVGARLLTKVPDPFPASSIEHLLAKISHGFLYSALIFMPISGLAFGYYSCWGVPFFNWHIPGAPRELENDPTYKAITDFFYVNHHRVGQILEWVLPIHIASVGYHHLIKGQNLMRRMNPFSKV